LYFRNVSGGFVLAPDYLQRQDRLCRKISAAKIDAVVLGGSAGADANAFYYCGDAAFPSFIIASAGAAVAYSSQEKDFFPDGIRVEPLSAFGTDLRRLLADKTVKAVGVDRRAASAPGLLFELSRKRKKPVDFTKHLLNLRLVKDAYEIACIQRAQKTTLECLEEVSRRVRCGRVAGESENYLAGICEMRARELGASLDAFPPIVQSGARTSVFHDATSNKPVGQEELLLVDIGARYRGYCGDATRTFYDGSDKKITDAVEAVQEAKAAGIKKAKVGAKGRAIADAALKVLREYGFEKFSFRKTGLSIGHFVGLEVHDGPSLEKTTLKRGMAFTVEPGVYVPGKFGVRFEDVVVLK